MKRKILRWVSAALLAAATFVAQAQTVVEYIHTDALGTPVAVTDANQNVVERSEYEPYGRLVNRPVADGPGYTGHVSDTATGLSYMQQRYYDAEIGTFVSVDPVGVSPTDGLNFNRYRYASNNPYTKRDPDGRCDGPSTCAIDRDISALNSGEMTKAEFMDRSAARAAGAAAGLMVVGAARTSPALLATLYRIVKSEADEAPRNLGTAGGPRAGKPFTPVGRREVIEKNRESNGGATRCEGCTTKTTPSQQSQKGVPTPRNETRVDHIIPQSKGGDGAPSNGQVLCSGCNLDKSNNMNWVPPKDRYP
ncbi:RHS repeat-associated core domain-containing protein [Lysobacter enzymogenes]|uniref:RHS repeat-associated core domain-containing protein n=1 Tax=Lysobacter enzymogenes TaxID=69 RepID=UPI00384F567A